MIISKKSTKRIGKNNMEYTYISPNVKPSPN